MWQLAQGALIVAGVVSLVWEYGVVGAMALAALAAVAVMCLR